jgi:hypothetical protein
MQSTNALEQKGWCERRSNWGPADGDLVKASSRTIEYRRLLNGERRAISVGLAPSSTESPPEVVQHEVSLWLGIVGTWMGFV